MEIMRKIPQYISCYIDESVDRAIDRTINSALEKQRVLFDKHMDLKFNELSTAFRSLHIDIVKEFEYHKGVMLDEFDSRLKTIGEYMDTKPSREEVRQIIHEEK